MQRIRVELGERSYSIFVSGSYAQLPKQLAALGLPRYGHVVSHASLIRRAAAALLPHLKRAGWEVSTITLPESESSKSFNQVQRLLGELALRSRMRTPVLFALGGGVVGDITGFAAAVFRRGVPYVQLPTTLLAQVDSAIGGKVGIDVPQAKNLVGAFYQPRLVWNHTGLLRTLPLRQRQSGLAEIIKYGAIADPELFMYLEMNLKSCLGLAPEAVQFMIERSCRIKARVVSRDERETRSIRAQLNFGHTIGHALEAATNYTRWTHGEAIAIGMCAASEMAAHAGLCSASLAGRIASLIRASGLPTRASNVSINKVKAALRFDKKFTGGRPRWVLPLRLGRVIVTENVPLKTVDAVLKKYLC